MLSVHKKWKKWLQQNSSNLLPAVFVSFLQRIVTHIFERLSKKKQDRLRILKKLFWKWKFLWISNRSATVCRWIFFLSQGFKLRKLIFYSSVITKIDFELILDILLGLEWVDYEWFIEDMNFEWGSRFYGEWNLKLFWFTFLIQNA